MPPIVDTTNFTKQQLDAFNAANALGSGVQTINSNDLSDAPTLKLPETPQTDPAELQGAISAIPSLDTLIAQFNAPSNAENNDNFLRSQIMQSLGNLGNRQADTIQAEQTAGIPQQQKELQELSNTLTQLKNESLAIPLQLQQEATGRGITAGGLEPIQTAKLRENAIRSLAVSAQAQAVAGNLALAQKQVDRMIDLKYAPEEQRLQYLERAYQFNQATLEREDKKKADLMRVQLDERSRILAERKENDKSIQSIMTTVSSYGVPQDVVKRIGAAKSVKDAITLASPYLRDPKDKAQLESIALNNSLAKIQIAKAQEELNIYRKYGGLTPDQWAKAKAAELEERKKSGEVISKAKQELQDIKDTRTQVNAILNNPAISTVVGPNILSRGTFRQKGIVSTALSAIGGAFTFGATTGGIPEITGSADTLVALTEQMLSQQFLDKLIESKGQGATFGALTDREGNSIRSAANAIAGTKIESDGKTIGYDLPEVEFKRQWQIILDALALAEQENQGTVFSPEEQELFDTMQSASLEPSSYYSTP